MNEHAGALADSPDDVRQLAREWPLCYLFLLPPGAQVLVVGAYQGKVMQLLADLYPRSRLILGYEPQVWAAERAVHRLSAAKYHSAKWDDLSCSVVNVGLGVEDAVVTIGEFGTDAASVVNVGPQAREHGEGTLWEADRALTQFLDKSPRFGFDLMVMNIEGYEFELLPHLARTGWLGRMNRVAVQWHLNLGTQRAGYDDIERTIGECLGAFRLVRDERPAWTYHERT